MTKSLTSLWLKNLRRVGKAQQTQGRKLLTRMLTPTARAPVAKKPVARVKPPQPLKAVKTPVAQALAVARPRRKPALTPKLAGAASQSTSPGTWQKSFFTLPRTGLAAARRMLYWLYLPSGATATAPRALVVMLHGCKQTPTDFAASTRMNQLAERKGFAVLYPQQSAASDSHRCWHWYKRATQQGQGDVMLIAEMIKQVQSKHRLDTSRTYVAGLSAGAGLAAILALRHPELIAAAGLHSSPVFGTSDSPLSGFQAMQQGASLKHREVAAEFVAEQPAFPGMPVMLIQGKNDAVVRRVNVDHLTAQFALIDAPFITSGQPVLRSYAGRAGGRSPRHAYKTATYYAGRKPEVVTCEIDALGHAWSGGEGSFDYSTPEGPDATLLLWNFFALHKRVKKMPAKASAKVPVLKRV